MPEPAVPTRRLTTTDLRFAATLADDVLAPAVARCVQAGRQETGGVILGRYAATLDCAEITELLPPPPGSRATASTFYRGTDGLHALLRERWRDGVYYLGEWHFHPFAAPDPSPADISQIQAIAADPGYRCPEPLLLILGADPRKTARWSLHVCPRGGRLLALEPRSDPSARETK